MAQPRTRKSLVSFSGGEMSPKMDARADMEKYQSGCRQLQNFWPLPQGGVSRRRGLRFVAAAKYDDPAKPVRMMRFEFSETDRLVIEAGDFYMRFFINGAPVMSGMSPYELVTPFSSANCFAMQFAQFEDIIIITNPSIAPMVLTRIANNSWTVAFVDFSKTMPPMLDDNATQTTIAASATTGVGVALVATGNVFNGGQVGGFFRLGYQTVATNLQLTLTSTQTSSTLSVLGPWTVNTYGKWSGTLLVQMSTDGGTTWETVRSYVVAEDANIADSGQQANVAALYRLKFTYVASTGSPDPRALFSIQNAEVNGLVQITAVADAQHATCTVFQALNSTSPTTDWSEGAFSTYRGFPTSVEFFQQRLWFGGTANNPQDLWGSRLAAYYDFTEGLLDTDAVHFTLSSKERNQILWILGQSKLFVGTTGGVWAAYGDELQGPITGASPPLVLLQNNFPCAYARPLLIDRSVLFVQNSGRKLREMEVVAFQGIYTANDLSVMADHITAGGMVTPCYQRDRDTIVWAVTGNGNLVGLTYEKAQNILAWHRHMTAGIFESVETVYNNVDDDVYVSVLRNINGTQKRFIEYFQGYFTPSVDQPVISPQAALTFQLPCLGPISSNLCACGAFPQPQVSQVTIGGNPGQIYPISFRVAGVAEGLAYTGGAQGNGWYVGGSKGGDTSSNIYQLVVSFPGDPTTTYFLNPGTAGLLSIWDYTNVLSVKGGSTLTLTANSQDNVQVANVSDATAPNINGVQQPYNGQFLQIQLTGAPSLMVGADLADNFFVDSGVSYNGNPVTVVTGLGHLEGMAVDVLADGNWIKGLTVASGQITLPSAASIVQVGLHYDSILQPMRIDNDAAAGNTQGLVKRVSKLVFRLLDTGGMAVADKAGDSPIAVPLPQAVGGALQQGDVELDLSADYDHDATFVATSVGPLPLTVLGVIVKYEVSEK